MSAVRVPWSLDCRRCGCEVLVGDLAGEAVAVCVLCEHRNRLAAVANLGPAPLVADESVRFRWMHGR